jgi:hypothetical protein
MGWSIIREMSDRKRKKLEKRRQETLSSIQDERWRLEAMVHRAQVVGDQQNPAQIVAEALARLSALEQLAREVSNVDDLDDIDSEAEEWGTFRAYICPLTENRT